MTNDPLTSMLEKANLDKDQLTPLQRFLLDKEIEVEKKIRDLMHAEINDIIKQFYEQKQNAPMPDDWLTSLPGQNQFQVYKNVLLSRLSSESLIESGNLLYNWFNYVLSLPEIKNPENEEKSAAQ